MYACICICVYTYVCLCTLFIFLYLTNFIGKSFQTVGVRCVHTQLRPDRRVRQLVSSAAEQSVRIVFIRWNSVVWYLYMFQRRNGILVAILWYNYCMYVHHLQYELRTQL